MYKIVHIAAECFPIAKTGGLGDVVGALPKYLNKAGVSTCVVIPKYDQKWHVGKSPKAIWFETMRSEHYSLDVVIEQSEVKDLGYDIYFVNIPALTFREKVYGYNDDHLRFLFFQQAVLNWMLFWKEKPAVLHCHDHHSGLIPFMARNCPKYQALSRIKTIFTIHNGLYTGAFSWENSKFLPDFHHQSRGWLDWDNTINPMAAGIKCCDVMTTVSEGYLDELKKTPSPLQPLYQDEWRKSRGIVNGIDADVWDPARDPYLASHFEGDLADFKMQHKEAICKVNGFNPDHPLVIFIGRLVGEKGAELLPKAIANHLYHQGPANFFVLGSGVSHIENELNHLAFHHSQVAVYIGYNEALAHQLYAGADFLLMPSLVEPCGLNQLYAMRYGTIPMVRSVGGLKDTVLDMGFEGGYGLRFDHATVEDVAITLYRAVEVFKNKEALAAIRERAASLNFSWENAVGKYLEIYRA